VADFLIRTKKPRYLMGCTQSTDAVVEAQKDRAVGKSLKSDMTQEYKIKKLLLLGPGESGKSTIFKQMVDLYGNGFSEKQKLEYIAVIHANLLISAKALSVASRRFAEEGKAECDVSEEVQPVKEFRWAWFKPARMIPSKFPFIRMDFKLFLL